LSKDYIPGPGTYNQHIKLIGSDSPMISIKGKGIKTILKINLYLTKWVKVQEMNIPISLIALGFQDQELMIKVSL